MRFGIGAVLFYIGLWICWACDGWRWGLVSYFLMLTGASLMFHDWLTDP